MAKPSLIKLGIKAHGDSTVGAILDKQPVQALLLWDAKKGPVKRKRALPFKMADCEAILGKPYEYDRKKVVKNKKTGEYEVVRWTAPGWTVQDVGYLKEIAQASTEKKAKERAKRIKDHGTYNLREKYAPHTSQLLNHLSHRTGRIKEDDAREKARLEEKRAFLNDPARIKKPGRPKTVRGFTLADLHAANPHFFNENQENEHVKEGTN